MAAFEIVALDTATPQLRAPGGADTYSIQKNVVVAFDTTFLNADGAGFRFRNYGPVLMAAGVDIFYINYGGLKASLNPGFQFAFGNPGAEDTGLSRPAAKVVKVTNGSSGAGCLLLPTFTVATLVAAATAGAGARSSVSDATQTFTSANFGTTVTGGGANFVPVVSDGTNWKIG